MVGARVRNDPSDSSASATRYSDLPQRALARPSELTRPPMTAVGSSPAAIMTAAIMVVVVVLPCAPATAMPNFMRISSPSISARGMTGMRRARAASTSGL
jgi:hypothetical protein